jgi:thymidylate kinase
LVFIVLEGFSGTGKTSLAKGLEAKGWFRLAESAHAVPEQVPVADRADTYADYSLLGATLQNCSIIAALRGSRNIVSEGYLLGDLAYARIRYDLQKSDAFPAMLTLVKVVLADKMMQPDLYFLLKAKSDTITSRQLRKDPREKNVSTFFQTRYYSAIAELHDRLGQDRIETLYTDGGPAETLQAILRTVKGRALLKERVHR